MHTWDLTKPAFLGLKNCKKISWNFLWNIFCSRNFVSGNENSFILFPLEKHVMTALIFLFSHLFLHLELYYFLELCNVGDCLPLWVAQPRPLFKPYCADHDGVSAIGVCIEVWVINIVIPRRDSNPCLRVSVYLNLTHALNRSATKPVDCSHLFSGKNINL